MWKTLVPATICLAILGPGAARATERYTDSTICVKWVDEETSKAMQSGIPPELSAIGCTMLWTSTVVPQWSVLRVPSGQADLAIAVATNLPQVRTAERDALVHPCTITPNDPKWPDQQTHFSLICLQGAWSKRLTSDKLIAVLDSGVKQVRTA